MNTTLNYNNKSLDGTLTNTCGNSILNGLIFLSVMFFSGLGNGLIIGSSYLDPEIRHGGLLAMVTLAVTDLIFANIFCLEALYTLICPSCHIATPVCDFLSIFKLMLVISVSYQHAFLAFTRYAAVYYPVKCKTWFTSKKVILSILSLFFMSTALSVLPSILPEPGANAFLGHYYDNSMMICIYSAYLGTIVYGATIFFLVPVSVSGFCYVSCFLKLKYANKMDSQANKQKHLAFTMLLAYALVLCNSGPFPIMTIIYMGDNRCNLVKRHFCWLMLANSCCNPMVYAWKSVKFRKMFAKQLRINLDKVSVAPISRAHTN